MRTGVLCKPQVVLVVLDRSITRGTTAPALQLAPLLLLLFSRLSLFTRTHWQELAGWEMNKKRATGGEEMKLLRRKREEEGGARMKRPKRGKCIQEERKEDNPLKRRIRMSVCSLGNTRTFSWLIFSHVRGSGGHDLIPPHPLPHPLVLCVFYSICLLLVAF